MISVTPLPAHLQLSAGYQKYAGPDVFPAALSPRGVFSRAPLPQFKGGGQGPGQSRRGTHTAGKPVRLVGIQKALDPRVLIQLHRETGQSARLRPSSHPRRGPLSPSLLPLQHSSSRGCIPLPLHPNPLGPTGPRTFSNLPRGKGPSGHLPHPLPLTSLFSLGTLLGSWHCSRVRSTTWPVRFAKAYCTT